MSSQGLLGSLGSLDVGEELDTIESKIREMPDDILRFMIDNSDRITNWTGIGVTSALHAMNLAGEPALVYTAYTACSACVHLLNGRTDVCALPSIEQ